MWKLAIEEKEFHEALSKMNDARWPDLQSFLAVARGGSLAAAAQALGTSTATLGRRIAALEAELGVALFAKDTNGYRRTANAETLMKCAESVEQAVLGFQRRLDGLSEEIAGTVRIAAPETIASHLLAPRVATLRSAYPALRIEFVTGPSAVSLPRRDADMAIRLDTPGEDSLHARKIGAIEFAVFAPRRAQPRLKETHGPSGWRWVGYERRLAQLPIARKTNAVFHPANQAAAADSLLVQSALAKHLSAAVVLPTYLALTDPDLEQIMEEPILTLPVWLVTSAETWRAPRIQAVATWVARSITV